MQHVSNGLEKVAWLGEAAPPMALSSYMWRHGISLAAPAAGERLSPCRLLTLDGVAHGSQVSNVDGSTVALVHPGASASDAIETVLRSHGAQVATLHPDDSLAGLEALIPDTILIDATDLHRSCWQVVRALWSHPWLRFVPLLVAPPGSLRTAHDKAWELGGIDAGLHLLHEGRRRLTATVRQHAHLSLELAQLGAARMLRALMDSERALRIRVDTQAHTFQVDVVGSLVFGARGGPRDGSDGSTEADASLAGPAALGALLWCDEGIVSVRECEPLRLTNIMLPLSSALQSAVTSVVAHDAASRARASASTQEASMDSPRPVAVSRREGRDDGTMMGMGLGSTRGDSAAPSTSQGVSRGSCSARRDDRTLAGLGRALERSVPPGASSRPLASDIPMLEEVAAANPTPHVASTVDAVEAAARRAVDRTLIGIGGMAPCAAASTTPLLHDALHGPALSQPLSSAVHQTTFRSPPAVVLGDGADLAPLAPQRPLYLLGAALLAPTVLVLVLWYALRILS